MSLPTKAIFYYDDKEVAKCFTNIGWVYREDWVPRLFKEMQNRPDKYWEYTDEWEKCGKHWDTVRLYSKTYTKKEIREMVKNV